MSFLKKIFSVCFDNLLPLRCLYKNSTNASKHRRSRIEQPTVPPAMIPTGTISKVKKTYSKREELKTTTVCQFLEHIEMTVKRLIRIKVSVCLI